MNGQVPIQEEEPLERPEAVSVAQLGGPPVGTPLCSLAELEDVEALTIAWGEKWERREIFIRAHGEGAVAYLNKCPHFSIPLNTRPGKFLNYTRERFLCANHYAQFRFEDGYCDGGICEGHWLVPVKIRVDAGQVLAG